MGRSKDRPLAALDALRPYLKRALEDEDLRDDLMAAFVAARSLYAQMQKGEGVRGKAERISAKDFQKKLQELVQELGDASDRLKGEKRHKNRNRVLLLTGVTLGVLFNPWTGPATREWIMKRITGEDGAGFEDLEAAGSVAGEEPAQAGEPAREEEPVGSAAGEGAADG